MNMEAHEVKHMALMRGTVAECMVLLKKNGDFPIGGPEKVALYGSGVRHTVKGGTGSGDVNSRFFVTVEQGFENAGFAITSKAWLDGYDAERQKAKAAFIADIKRRAKEQHKLAMMVGMGAVMPEPVYDLPMDGEGELAVYVLARNSGEGNDRLVVEGDIKLTSTEVRDILACQKKYKKFMLVLNVGGMVDLSPVQEVENILLMSQLGVVTGDVLADVILGKAYPSGKLTTTWGTAEDIAAIDDFGNRDETRYHEGIYVGYRWYDSAGKKPVYPFGFGLGYGDFSYGEAKAALEGTTVTVKTTVKNTGKHPGKEAVQLYVTAPWGKLDQPYQKLTGFAKTGELAPGQAAEVAISFKMEDIASYDEASAAYILEAGNYILRVGASSAETKVCGVVNVPEEILVRKLSPIGGKPDFADWKPEHSWAGEDISGVPVLTLEKEALADLSWPAPSELSKEAKEFVKKLSDEDLAKLVIGNYGKGGLLSVIGDASTLVAGAAGESYGKIPGVPPIVMADGPAGLRLSQKYTRDEKGVHSAGITLPAGFEELMPGILLFFMKLSKKKPKGQVFEQYCTAMPIGTALAQSFNLELCKNCGDMVGAEMETYGVHLWLAPAFNIHRSVLCGRNFEYCSEDPLVSGLVSAALTKGVQKHPGRGVTVKHFCVNNQEHNRYQNNSMLSERALREIYIKGFEICLLQGKPVSLMTSYNLLNGIHTSERPDLLKTFLREELGWGGLVMTDWVVSAMNNKDCKHRMEEAAPTIAAGNDLFMPGAADNYKQVLEAMQGKNEKYRITREDVEYCACHVVETAWKLCGKK